MKKITYHSGAEEQVEMRSNAALYQRKLGGGGFTRNIGLISAGAENEGINMKPSWKRSWSLRGQSLRRGIPHRSCIGINGSKE